MWETVQVSVGLATHRGRYRVQGRRLVLEWRGGRTFEWCGILKPSVVAEATLKQLVSRPQAAA